jgi:hypothetical protein
MRIDAISPLTHTLAVYSHTEIATTQVSAVSYDA